MGPVNPRVSDEVEPLYHTSQLRDTAPPGDQPDEDIPIHLTDRGNALRLVKAHGQNLHYIYRWKKWLVWDGTRWVVDEGNLVERLAKQVITELYLTLNMPISRCQQRAATKTASARRRASTESNKSSFATATLKWALKSESSERLARDAEACPIRAWHPHHPRTARRQSLDSELPAMAPST